MKRPYLARLALLSCLTGAVACGNTTDLGGHNGPTTVAPGGTVVCPDLPLKTARAPRLLWSCERQAFLTKLHDMNHPMWQELLGLADRTDTENARYADNGSYAAIVYQITGDDSYALKAINQALKELGTNKVFNLNYTRGQWEELAIDYDWIQGGIPEDKRKEFEDVLYGWADQFFARDPKTPIRTNDTDQTTGNYFGIVMTALATQGGNPRAEELLSAPFVGGYDPTGSDLSTMRNAIHKYITEWAPGGVWIESAYYDIETLQLVIEGVEGLRTALGVDHFPEMAPLKEQVVRSQMEQLTPDFEAAAKWGDCDDPREVQAWRRYQTLGMYIGTLDADSPLRPIATQFTNDLKAQYQTDLIYQARWYYYFDPAAPTADWHTMPLSHYAPGQQMVFAHDGWDKDDSLLFLHLRRPEMGVDHENKQFGNFELYRKGGWVLTRPLGYGGGSVEPLAVNAMVLAGLDGMIDRTVIDEAAAADGSYLYFAGTSKGQRYVQPYYDPPDEFVHEWTRSFLYLPTTAHTADTVVVYDRVDATPPTRLDRYLADDQARINGQTKLKQFVLHTVVSPAISGDSTTWTAAGQAVELTTLAPLQRDAVVVDENTLGWPQDFPADNEKHFYVSISPKTSQAWDTFLDVLQASDTGVTTKPVRVTSSDGAVEGTRVSRPGQLDAVALFSATQGTRVRSTAFTVSANIGTDGFDLYVADLDPSKKWSASPGGDLAVDAGGFGHARAAGIGTVGITITPN